MWVNPLHNGLISYIVKVKQNYTWQRMSCDMNLQFLPHCGSGVCIPLAYGAKSSLDCLPCVVWMLEFQFWMGHSIAWWLLSGCYFIMSRSLWLFAEQWLLAVSVIACGWLYVPSLHYQHFQRAWFLSKPFINCLSPSCICLEAWSFSQEPL